MLLHNRIAGGCVATVVMGGAVAVVGGAVVVVGGASLFQKSSSSLLTTSWDIERSCDPDK